VPRRLARLYRRRIAVLLITARSLLAPAIPLRFEGVAAALRGRISLALSSRFFSRFFSSFF